jgi:hypothetical protein
MPLMDVIKRKPDHLLLYLTKAERCEVRNANKEYKSTAMNLSYKIAVSYTRNKAMHIPI